MIWVIFVIVVLSVMVVTVLWLTRSALFSPEKKMIWEPTEEYQDLYLPNNTGHASINSWYFERNPKAPCILFFHGNNGNMSWRKYMTDATRCLGVNMLMIDYRGFGRSRGKATQRGVCQDGLCAYDYLSKAYKPEDIIIWGESLGGSIATWVASNRPCRCLVLFSTFSSLDDIVMASSKNPIAMKAMAFLIKYLTNEMPTKIWIESVEAPVVVIHSDEDTLIPYSVSEKLYSHIKHDKKSMVTIKGDHSTPDLTHGELEEVLRVCGLGSPCKGVIRDVLNCIENANFPTS